MVVERVPQLQLLWLEALQVWNGTIEGMLIVECSLASQSICKLFPAQVWWCNTCQNWQQPGCGGMQTAGNVCHLVQHPVFAVRIMTLN